MTIDENITEIDRKVNYDCPIKLRDIPYYLTWHRVENSRADEPRISFRLMCNENIPMKHWIELQGKKIKCIMLEPLYVL